MAHSHRILSRVTRHLARAQAIQTNSFTYDLPADRIAYRPLTDRHSSKLLVVPRDFSPPRHTTFSHLPSLLPPHSLLVRNVTRVIPARLPVRKSTGGRAEVLLLHPTDDTSPGASLDAPTERIQWRALLNGRKLSEGDVLTINPSEVIGSSETDPLELRVTIDSKHPLPPTVSLTAEPPLPLRDCLSRLGLPPLPPYIRRRADDRDQTAFQTVYGTDEGSVAAPTAGLHVTPSVLSEISERKISVADIVLHIGVATFRPVTAEVAGSHEMHHESISVPGYVVQQLAQQHHEKRSVIALGTTSVRTIESLYWWGVRLISQPAMNSEEAISVKQWEPYEQMDNFSTKNLPSAFDALSAVLDWCGGPQGHVHGGTNLLIVPGYPFMM